MAWIKGVPPNTGDTFTVVMLEGEVVEISFCPQLGWIDKDWNPANIDYIVKYLK